MKLVGKVESVVFSYSCFPCQNLNWTFDKKPDSEHEFSSLSVAPHRVNYPESVSTKVLDLLNRLFALPTILSTSPKSYNLAWHAKIHDANGKLITATSQQRHFNSIGRQFSNNNKYRFMRSVMKKTKKLREVPRWPRRSEGGLERWYYLTNKPDERLKLLLLPLIGLSSKSIFCS